MTAVLGAPAVPAALEALRADRPVLLAGGPDDGAIVLAASRADPAWVAWAVRHSAGFLTVAMTAARAVELELPAVRPSGPGRPAHTVAVDAAAGITTGISAADRARTARVLADPAALPGDLRRPGHVVGVRTAPGGVLGHAGVPEAAVDLCRLAGLPPVAVVAALDPDSGERPLALAEGLDLPVLTAADVVVHRLAPP